MECQSTARTVHAIGKAFMFCFNARDATRDGKQDGRQMFLMLNSAQEMLAAAATMILGNIGH